jgi:hypothetical protein
MVQVINVITIKFGIIDEVKSFTFETMGMKFEEEEAVNKAEEYFVEKVIETTGLTYTKENAENDVFVFDKDNINISLVWSI